MSMTNPLERVGEAMAEAERRIRMERSAPDGYALALAVMAWYDSAAPHGSPEMYEKARAIIAKVDGHD
jgi:hypothetical protein